MFDLQIADKSSRQFNVEIPDETEDWKVGLIVGPSGSGKSTVAREVFGDRLWTQTDWPSCAVVDAFDEDLTLEEITSTLTSVGFSSPPAWIRPYHTLSNGEQFRCDLARSLLSSPGTIVFDEFTSVVDRQVAKIGSYAVSKSVRKARVRAQRFVAVTCHYDIAEWLEPDWVLDMSSQTLARGRLRRPGIELEIRAGGREGWSRFATHHYLSPSVPAASQFYYAFVNNRLCGVVVVSNQIGVTKGNRRVSRIVVFPDFQGIGIGAKLLSSASKLAASGGNEISIVTSHPGMISHLKTSSDWKILRLNRPHPHKSDWRGGKVETYQDSGLRNVICAIFVG
jgi:energy-coupling factor transporter ATP-binding protein EcfA2